MSAPESVGWGGLRAGEDASTGAELTGALVPRTRATDAGCLPEPLCVASPCGCFLPVWRQVPGEATPEKKVGGRAWHLRGLASRPLCPLG